MTFERVLSGMKKGGCLPVLALLLYLLGGSPDLPSIPRDAEVAQRVAHPVIGDELRAMLRARVVTPNPSGAEARPTYIEIGRAEALRGNMASAAAAWNAALGIQFAAMLAAVTAEALTEAAGHVTDESAALFKLALVSAPANAAWSSIAEERLNEHAQVSPSAADRGKQ